MNIWEAAALFLFLGSTAAFVMWKIYYYKKRSELRREVRAANEVINT